MSTAPARVSAPGDGVPDRTRVVRAIGQNVLHLTAWPTRRARRAPEVQILGCQDRRRTPRPLVPRTQLMSTAGAAARPHGRAMSGRERLGPSRARWTCLPELTVALARGAATPDGRGNRSPHRWTSCARRLTNCPSEVDSTTACPARLELVATPPCPDSCSWVCNATSRQP